MVITLIFGMPRRPAPYNAIADCISSFSSLRQRRQIRENDTAKFHLIIEITLVFGRAMLAPTAKLEEGFE